MAYITEDKIEDPAEKKEVQSVLHAINAQNKKNLWRLKRTADIILSTLGIIVSFIPMLIISLCIFLDDGHSPFFCQTRVGRLGVPFKMYKFRTMVPNAEKIRETILSQNEMDGPVFKIKNDPRITRVGSFLRKTSLDELPQFFNVLKGDMTLIGPRPPLPKEVACYTEYQKIRLIVTPGITCIWQVQPQRNSISFDDWIKMDIKYVVNRNIFMDIRILFDTALAMIRREGL